MPLPDICTVALARRRDAQAVTREAAGPAWQPSDLVFTTRYGRPVEPRNFNRFWDRRCDLAGVRRLTARDVRRTCASRWASHSTDERPTAVLRCCTAHDQGTFRSGWGL
ncbi:hypothetical protein [Micromonospora zhanjiangensis]|uniref:Uncharacterized protein n=1 Tax=Micromonospora zhanjiangensis TaxID=1522057 RepID=A0ABV8KUQ7_9ACTN